MLKPGLREIVVDEHEFLPTAAEGLPARVAVVLEMAAESSNGQKGFMNRGLRGQLQMRALGAQDLNLRIRQDQSCRQRGDTASGAAKQKQPVGNGQEHSKGSQQGLAGFELALFDGAAALERL